MLHAVSLNIESRSTAGLVGVVWCLCIDLSVVGSFKLIGVDQSIWYWHLQV